MNTTGAKWYGAGVTAVLLIGCLNTGCKSFDQRVAECVVQGEYGNARTLLVGHLNENRGDRRYMLDRMKLCICELADGLPNSAEPTASEAYEILRTQGINADKTVASVVINERVKFWKGEPFEQAMMFYYIAVQKALRGEWDNARAAAQGSLFLLKDFGSNENGERKTAADLTKAAAKHENENRKNENAADYFDAGYVPTKTDFTLGYLLAGIANAALGGSERENEAADNFRAALDINAGLQSVVERFLAKRYNTVLVVDYGLGPQKTSYGPDRVYARFIPRPQWPSTTYPLHVSVNGNGAGSFPAACDLNAMAQDHMWNNLEDVRLAKSRIGSGLVTTGVASMMSRNNYARIAGAAVALVGVAMKASARADTRHCDIMPQRVYVAPLTVTKPCSRIELQVGDAANVTGHMVLNGIDPPERPQHIRLVYTRITPSRELLPWSDGTRVLYANDSYPNRVDGDTLPYILGGRCVCKPSAMVLARYQQAGYLRDLTPADLSGLYTEEGIQLELDATGRAGQHILEGGNFLECPLPGSPGFLRLFCQEHPPYQPKSDLVRRLAEEIAGGSAVDVARANSN